ncbi:hypothetical protein N2152v2_006786 [Parachlorella kessleri]
MHQGAGWSRHNIATSRPTAGQRQVQPANSQQLTAGQLSRQTTPAALQQDAAVQSSPCSSRRAVLLGGTSALVAWQLGAGDKPASAAVDPFYLAPLDGVPLMPADRAFVERLKARPARKASGAACPAQEPQPALRPVSGSAPESRASAFAQLDSVPLTPLDQLWLERFKEEEALRTGSTPV